MKPLIYREVKLSEKSDIHLFLKKFNVKNQELQAIGGSP